MTIRTRVGFAGGWAEYDSAKIPVVVGDRAVPQRIEVTFPGGTHSEQPALTFVIEMIDEVPTCTELNLQRREGRRGVLGADLRAIRLADWIEDIVAVLAGEVRSTGDNNIAIDYRGDAESARAARHVLRQVPKRGRRRITDEHLQRVAEVFEQHRDGTPTAAVRDAFDVPYRTASRWVQMARERRILK